MVQEGETEVSTSVEERFMLWSHPPATMRTYQNHSQWARYTNILPVFYLRACMTHSHGHTSPLSRMEGPPQIPVNHTSTLYPWCSNLRWWRHCHCSYLPRNRIPCTGMLSVVYTCCQYLLRVILHSKGLLTLLPTHVHNLTGVRNVPSHK